VLGTGATFTTVRCAEPVMPESVHVIFVTPAFKQCTRPPETVATDVLLEIHVAEVETFTFDPFEYVPNPVNIAEDPAFADEFAGTIVIDVSVGVTGTGGGGTGGAGGVGGVGTGGGAGIVPPIAIKSEIRSAQATPFGAFAWPFAI
jgi:hypothetical protein